MQCAPFTVPGVPGAALVLGAAFGARREEIYLCVWHLEFSDLFEQEAIGPSTVDWDRGRAFCILLHQLQFCLMSGLIR